MSSFFKLRKNARSFFFSADGDFDRVGFQKLEFGIVTLNNIHLIVVISLVKYDDTINLSGLIKTIPWSSLSPFKIL